MREEILKALREAGIKKGDTVFVHSDASSAIGAGNIFRPLETLEALVTAFLETIGPEGTLLAPTFNYDF